jgi:uncharacterized protein (TIGR03000 family)
MRFILPALIIVFGAEVNASPRPNQHTPVPSHAPQTPACSSCQNHPTSHNHPTGTGNSNGNSNTNNNTNNNSNKVNVNVNANVTGGSSSSSASTGSSSSSASGGSTTINTPAASTTTNYGNPGASYSRIYSPSFTDGRSYSPSFGGQSYSPGFSSPSYGGGGGFSGGAAPIGGFGGGFAAAGEAVMPVANNLAENPATAWLTVDLPHENSDVYLNGIKMPQKGITRKYVTPPLNKQATYHYALKVVWPDALGMKKVYNTNIELKAGDEIRHTVPGALNALPPLPNQGPAPPKKEVKAEEPKMNVEKRIQFRLSFAKEMFDAGKIDKGKKWLEDIIIEYPDSKGAEEARDLLSKIK